ncbi:MAG: cytochrome c biogenesis protein CcsA [Gammaproteobacteria bacterium]|nr:cytochrome c biogenesis protein CcsA [Gammaproteobacteria bacterium]
MPNRVELADEGLLIDPDAMPISLLSLLAATLYVVAATLLYRRHKHTATPILLTVSVAVALHAYVLYANIFAAGGVNVRLADAGSLIAWITALAVLLATLSRTEMNLGLLIFPVAALAVLCGWLLPGRDLLISTTSAVRAGHSLLAILAFGCLGLAVAQALLLAYQDRQLRLQPPVVSTLLPPLESMETLLFRLIAVGFVLLTVALLTGVLFNHELSGAEFPITHHTVLSVAAWICFGLLLGGHRIYGWRGRNAVHWTLGGFAILFLGYFGSRFVLEIILNR